MPISGMSVGLTCKKDFCGTCVAAAGNSKYGGDIPFAWTPAEETEKASHLAILLAPSLSFILKTLVFIEKKGM